jgi:TetR/AcrR family transcriptional regulator
MEESRQFLEQLELDHLSPEDAITFIVRVAIANEFRNPYRQILWFQEASQDQGFCFKQGN